MTVDTGTVLWVIMGQCDDGRRQLDTRRELELSEDEVAEFLSDHHRREEVLSLAKTLTAESIWTEEAVGDPGEECYEPVRCFRVLLPLNICVW